MTRKSRAKRRRERPVADKGGTERGEGEGKHEDGVRETRRQRHGDEGGEFGEEENGGSAIIVILAVVSLIIALRLRNRMSDEEDDFDSEDEEIPEQVLAFATTPMSIDSATNVVEEVVTQVQQWTDESGYTWRKMSDESIQWWNGTDWQDHA